MKRTSIEISPDRLEAIRVIAIRTGTKHKWVLDQLLRYGLLRVEQIFPYYKPKPLEDSGK